MNLKTQRDLRKSLWVAHIFLIHLRWKSFVQEMDSSYVVVVAELALRKFAAIKSSKPSARGFDRLSP